MLSNKTEFNKEWKEYSLEELGQFSRGKSKHRPRDDKSLFGGKYPFIQTGDIKQSNLWVNSFSKTYNEKGLEQSKLWGKDTLCITIAANIAETAILKFDACFPDSVVGFISDKNKSNVYFMHYLFCFIKQKIQRATSGSVQDNINIEFLKKLRLNIPPLEKQEKIANILLSLDNKIELNNEMNNTLEDMAQSIFKRWFVDFEFPNEDGLPYKSSGGEMVESEFGMIPKGWQVKTLDEALKVTIGKTPPRKEKQWFTTNNEDIKWVSIKDLGNSGTYIFETSECLTRDAIKKYNVKVVPENTVLLSFKLTVGRVSITTEDMATNEAIAHFIIEDNENISTEYLYSYLKNFNYDKLGSTSSIATAINSKIVKKMPIILPNEEIIKKFNCTINDIFRLINKNQKENISIKELKNILLEKMMRGEFQL